jgi:ATP-binding cassette subfamily B protein
MEDSRAIKGDIGKLLRFVKPYRRLALFAFVMLLGMVALDLAVPRLIERIIDEGIKAKDMGVVLRTAALMLLVSASSALVAVLNSNSSVRVGESVARDLREALFVRIEGFSYGNLDEFSTGTLMVRLTSDSSAVQRLVQVSLRIGTRAPLTMIGSIILMFVTSPRLASLMIPLLFVAGAAIVFFSLRMEPLFRDVQGKLDRLNTVLQENIAGARLVKSFVRAGRETERFDAANEDLNERTIRVQELMSSMSPLLTLLVNVGMVLVIYVGGLDAAGGRLSLGQIIAFTNYLLATLQPLTMMTQLSNTWANGLASLKRINEVLDAEPEVKESPNALPAPGGAGVSFERVDFRYKGDAKVSVLDSVSFDAEPGTVVAVLGATGSGKSSLVNLIPRFYDVTGGAVRIGGLDVRDMRESSLLGLVAVVPQESVLFSGTVRDNIRYGKPGASEEEVVAAAKAAQAHEFILALPQGYDTHIEERGGNLSGGQKQRIAIARAAIMRPDILIMDDSTSAVDVETETKIQAALKDYLSDSTCFVVAQRISTVLNADRILVLDEGRVVALGRHAELLESSPIYREIYDSQLGGGVHAD